MRTVSEWIAKHDNEKIPDRVKLRIWQREGGRCYLTGKPIRPGDKYQFEHVKSLAHGGEHREGNIRIALDAPHKQKSAGERKLQAKSDRIRKRHLGFKKTCRKLPGSRDSDIKFKLNGQRVNRHTGQPIRERWRI